MGRSAVVLPALVALTAALASRSANAQSKKSRASAPPSIDSLAAVTERGRALAEYDRVAWLGGDAMTSLSLPPDEIRRLIARPVGESWEVAAGTLSERGDTLRVAYLSTPGMQGDQWASTWFDPPRRDTGYFARAARAIESAVAMFVRPARRPYVATVIPTDDASGWFVYLYPAPTADGRWPLGGDARFRVSADGRVVIESKRLHESIKEYSARSSATLGETARTASPANGLMPEDTDVFHVLQRRPAMPALMSIGRFRYRIDVDGSIRLLGTR